MTTSNLFDSDFNSEDLELNNFLLDVHSRRFLNEMANKYLPFVKEQEKFISGIKSQPFTRIWEMYLGCALQECGLPLVAVDEIGPDIKLSDPTIWIEATVSTDGDVWMKDNAQM